MIDIHSHILPEMDDGSKSVSESIQMLRLSSDMGIDTMVSTSHYYSDSETIEEFLSRRNEKQNILKRELEGISEVPQIVMGAEVTYFSGMSREKEISRLCIDNTKYMLLEMPFFEWTSLTIKEVQSLISNRGITPIIAHIERHLPHQQRYEKMQELLSLGVVFQTNGEAVINGTQKRNILKMIDSNKIHLLGSDCHDISERAPNLGKAYQTISKKLGNAILKRIDLNGRRILNDEWI